jgi:hypothetical protein
VFGSPLGSDSPRGRGLRKVIPPKFLTGGAVWSWLSSSRLVGGLRNFSFVTRRIGWRSRLSFRIRPGADSQLWMRLPRRCFRTCFQSLKVRPRALVIRLNVEGLCVHLGCEVSPPGLLVRYS